MEASLHALVLLAAPAIALAVCVRHGRAPGPARAQGAILGAFVLLCLMFEFASNLRFLLPLMCAVPVVIFVQRPAALARAAVALAVIGIGLSAHHHRLAQGPTYTARAYRVDGDRTSQNRSVWHSALTSLYVATGDRRPETGDRRLNPAPPVPSHN